MRPRESTPFMKSLILQLTSSPNSGATIQRFSRSPLTHHLPQTRDPWTTHHRTTKHPIGTTGGQYGVHNKRMNLQDFHCYSSNQITTSVSSFFFFYHILFPSELVEIMGANDTKCSPFLPSLPSSWPS